MYAKLWVYSQVLQILQPLFNNANADQSSNILYFFARVILNLLITNALPKNERIKIS